MDTATSQTLLYSALFFVVTTTLPFVVGAVILRGKDETARKLRSLKVNFLFLFIVGIAIRVGVGDELNFQRLFLTEISDPTLFTILNWLSAVVVYLVSYLLSFVLPVYVFSRKIRGITIKAGTYISRNLIAAAVTITEWAILFAGFLVIKDQGYEALPRFFLNLLLTAFVLFLTVTATNIQLKVTRSRDKDREVLLFPGVSQFSAQCGVALKHLFFFKTDDLKYANAFAYGFFKPTVGLYSYAYDNLSEQENMAVIAHEFGHIRYRHTGIRIFVSGVMLLLSMYLIDHFSNYPLLSSPVAYYFILFGVVVLCTRLLPGYLYRYQEHQADLFAARHVQDPVDLGRALVKLTKLNDAVMPKSNANSLLSTHPILFHRMVFLERKLGITINEVLRKEFFPDEQITVAAAPLQPDQSLQTSAATEGSGETAAVAESVKKPERK